MLRLAGTSIDDLIYYYYKSIIRPSPGICLSCQAFLFVKASVSLNRITARRAMHIIFDKISYLDSLLLANIENFCDRRGL